MSSHAKSSLTIEALQKAVAGRTGTNLTLLCRRCGATYSADPSDYFWMGPRDGFYCLSCRLPLSLCERRVTYTEVEL